MEVVVEVVVALMSLVLLGGALLCLAFIALATMLGRMFRVATTAVSARSGRWTRRPLSRV